MNDIKIHNWDQLNEQEQSLILSRPALFQRQEQMEKVQDIILDVKTNGQEALKRLAAKFDPIAVDSFRVSEEKISESAAQLSPSEREAIERSFNQIHSFHQQETHVGYDLEPSVGVKLWKRYLPIEKVGLYIPGGTAPLPSTVLMLGVPAMLAGCQVKVLATPPNKEGLVHPAILYAAQLCGIQTIYKMGGAHAIAAMAYGTEEVLKVDKIFGPGNSWVTEAKVAVSQDPEGAALDMPAGPSEVMVICDHLANCTFAASDLLSQAEHGEDSQTVLVSTSLSVLEGVKAELKKQIPQLSRKSICEASLKHCRLILVESLATAFEVSNLYAPEHLILQIEDPERWESKIQHAGSVFMGPYTPESMGDYASGTNHVLPTYGYARAFSGLSTQAFMKHITFQKVNQSGLRDLGPTVETMARMEGLTAHKNAVTLRLQAISSGEANE